MRKISTYLLFICVAACKSSPDNTLHEQQDSSSKTYITNDTIPPVRKKINPDPVASYSQKVPDDINDWKFSVAIFETKQTFQYQVKLQYKELIATDSLRIPNFGTQPKVEIVKGKHEMECIIGFRDAKDNFKEYKLVSAQNDKLKIATIKSYFVGMYSTKQSAQ